MPAASISGTRAMPLPSFAFEDGLCEICVPVSRISAISASDNHTQCAAMQRSYRIPQSYATSVGRRPNRSFEFSTSVRDSLRWMWMPVLRSSASMRASFSRPSDASGSHSIPM